MLIFSQKSDCRQAAARHKVRCKGKVFYRNEQINKGKNAAMGFFFAFSYKIETNDELFKFVSHSSIMHLVCPYLNTILSASIRK